MKTKVTWNNKMNFTALAGSNQINIDDTPPLGKGDGMTPKQLLLISIAGCTAMDVISLLKKYKQEVKAFTVEIEAQKSEGDYPVVFTEAQLIYQIQGANLDNLKIRESVELSQTKYCGVSAMLSKAFPIDYRIVVNGEEIGKGQSNFNF